MKNIFLSLCFAAVLCLGSCKNEKKEYPLNECFTAFVVKDESRQELTGVRRNTDGQTVMEPDNYLSVSADSCFIVGRKGEFSFDVRRTDGTEVGTFDTFTGFARGYYMGTRYRTTCYYFPRYDLLLCSDQVEAGTHALLFGHGSYWEVRSYTGERLWQGKEKPDADEWNHFKHY